MTATELGAAEFIVDYQPPRAGPAEAVVLVRGHPGRLTGAEPGKFSRFTVTVAAGRVRVAREGGGVTEAALPAGLPPKGPFALVPATAGGVFTNLHARDL